MIIYSLLIGFAPNELVYADMAELADALDSGSSECKFMQVQVLLSAPTMEGCPSGLRS